MCLDDKCVCVQERARAIASAARRVEVEGVAVLRVSLLPNLKALLSRHNPQLSQRFYARSLRSLEQIELEI